MKKFNFRKAHSKLKYGHILVLALKIRVNNGKNVSQNTLFWHILHSVYQYF